MTATVMIGIYATLQSLPPQAPTLQEYWEACGNVQSVPDYLLWLNQAELWNVIFFSIYLIIV